ncbi:helix-turn-helix domain-containing protein [Psychrobacter fulvigenes]|uniref:helix-turn-helix domain-containing protein n=1 Tax=Psychrobacter fulvigenes TaxID=533323 RepID=UPI00191951DF|nr:helix-turn-helix transcriptional regulator [Psychrobacter fulvigenes]
MVKCHLSTIMGERRLKIADVARDTGTNRGTITRMYHEEATLVDLDVIESLCTYLRINVGDLYEIINEDSSETPE